MFVIRANPSTRDVRIFAALWAIFFAGLGALALWKPDAFRGPAVFVGAAWLISMLFNRSEGKRQGWGLLLPGIFSSVMLALDRGVPAGTVTASLIVVGVLGGLSIGLLGGFGRRVYEIWMLAVAPVGWTVSQIVLGVVYYVVLTPIGLLMRGLGRDPMRRRIEPDAKSYWVERRVDRKPGDYFRQF